MPRKVKVEEKNEELNIAVALDALCKDKGLPTEVVISALTEAFKKAYFRNTKDYTDTVLEVNIDPVTGKIEMFKLKNVVEEIQDDVLETDPEEAFEATGVEYKVGDVVKTPIDISSFKRMAASLFKNVFKQKLREAEKQQVVDNFQDKVGAVLSGVVEAVEAKHCIVKLANHTNAYLNKSNMLPNETLKLGATIKVFVEEVDKAATGAPIIVSRTNPRFITRLMESEISEISEGIVEIKGVSRQPGSRSKVAVYSKDPNIDPSGACIGPRGSRINRVLTQIGSEKIDVVNYSENPLLYVADALKPAIIIGMQMLDEKSKSCRAIVSEDQYSLAIGKEAQNVNLAVRLTGWKIDIKTERDALEQGYDYQNVEDLKLIEAAKRNRNANVTYTAPVVEETKPSTPMVEKVEDDLMVTPTTSDSIESTPVVEQVITPSEPKVKPTTSKSVNVFSELEAALNASNNNDEKPVAKKKTTKKTVDKPVEEEVKVEPKKTPTTVLPIYTEEELKAIADEEAEEENKYNDDIDYDEFDEYYDDED